MDVAPHFDDTVTVEKDFLLGGLRKEGNIELVPFGKRVNVMLERVFV
tara:strand:- start:36 stop:176 length:141 start_codon:yes stop_codon:yes gene_type:complete